MSKKIIFNYFLSMIKIFVLTEHILNNGILMNESLITKKKNK